MHNRLLLKNVILVPHLADFFIECTVNTIKEIPQSNIPTVLERLSEKDEWAAVEIPVGNEKELQDAIRDQVGLYPLSVASCLLFGNADQLTLQEPNAAAYNITGAKGKLDLSVDIADLPENPAPELNLVTQMLRERGGSPMAWELKGLTAGDTCTMTAIVAQKGLFQWIKCDKVADDCEKIHHWNRFRPGISGAPRGPDAQLPELPMKTGVKGQDNLVPNPVYDLGLQQTQVEKGRWILQQVWAGAVASDTTLVVIRSGNWEVYGIRIRSTQTLLISPVIDIRGQPDYLLLQAGLVIFAYKDAVKRAISSSNGIDPFADLKYDYPAMKEQKSSYKNTVEGPKDIHAIIQAHYPNGITKIQLYGFGSEPEGLNFTRAPEFIRSGNFTDDPQAILYLLQEQKKKRKTDKTFEGILNVSGERYRVVVKMSRADTGTDLEELEDEYLRTCTLSSIPGIREGLVWSVGLYKHEVETDTQSSTQSSTAENCHCMWVMVWAGKDLTNYKTITPKAQNQLKDFFSRVHQNGWAHTKITARPLVWDNISETITVLSWENSKEKDDKLRKRDRRQLRSILRDLRKGPHQKDSSKRKRIPRTMTKKANVRGG
ncbi:hypothetical protein AX16_004949 [Volvariella volvacea WC 439]|nr:hypothetical protein AX16_004949 [Volvariella volvacea WC 439]